MEDTLGAHPEIAATPRAPCSSSASIRTDARPRAADEGASRRSRHELDAVESLDEDRILRGFLTLVDDRCAPTISSAPDGEPKPYLAVKLASREIELLPLPRPLCEIYVYSPRMEGVHMRAGKVARGGIRWSDRKEDFRTEILGLMKAQMVKNAVIVPIGSKGGFVVKRPPAGRARRAAPGRRRRVLQDPDARRCSTSPTTSSPSAQRTHRAAASGRAPRWRRPLSRRRRRQGHRDLSPTSPTSIAEEYGFWLGDAFASGGSAGYDHKAIGITARGAWELVKRHFRELGTDIQAADLHLRRRRRHVRRRVRQRHAAVAPPAAPRRLRSSAHLRRSRSRSRAQLRRAPAAVRLPRSSWADYDRALISPGGGVFERSVKSIAVARR